MPNQIVLTDTCGRLFRIELVSGMSAEGVRRKMTALGIDDLEDVTISFALESAGCVGRMARELWPNAEFETIDEQPMNPDQLLYSCEANDHLFRSIARIAFHYYLIYNRSDIRGDEPGFADVRRFIRDGDEPEPFFSNARSSPVYFATPFGRLLTGDTVRPANWNHLFVADDTQVSAVVYVQLFLGPESIAPPYYVLLGQIGQAVCNPTAWAHRLSWSVGSTTPGTVRELPVYRGGPPIRISGPGLDGCGADSAIYTTN